MKRKTLVCILLLAMIVTMLAGCGTTNKATEDNGKAAGKPIKDSVTFAISADIESLDPINSTRSSNNMVFWNCCNTLLSYDSSGKIAPELAENWTISDDGLTYTFNLKKGVKFTNGEELKAKDVIYTFNASRKSPYSASFVADVKEITAIDDYSLKIVLNAPNAAFLLNLNLIYIVNEKAVKDASGKYGQDNMVGTGAYKFIKHDAGQSVTLERNEDYFGTKPQIKTIELKVITDTNAGVIALQSGDVDVLQEIPAASINTIKNNSKLAMYDMNAISISFLSINITKKPFDNLLIRQAINYAIDKEAVIQMAENGVAKKADLFINKLTFGYSDKVKAYEYNIEKAKELLAQAGYPNGFKVTIKTLDGEYKKIAEVVQDNLRKIGITANVELGEQNAVISDYMSGNYELGCISIGMLPDLDSWSIVFTSNSPYNFSKYSNPKVDELFAKGKKFLNENDRLSVYQELLQTISDDAPIVPVCFPTFYMGMSKDLKLNFIDPCGKFKIENMAWAKK